MQSLATNFPQYTYLLGVRSPTAGQEAIKSLQDLGLTSTFEAIEIDITDDTSIASASATVKQQHGNLHILINNAAIAERISPGDPAFRQSCNKVLDANVTSFFQTTLAFLPILQASSPIATADSHRPQVINISSARGSMHRMTTGALPPTANIPYSISKTALNVAMLEFAKLHPDVLFQAASPGHCKTAFNGYRGVKDPVDGAEVVVRLVGDGGRVWGGGFYEVEGGEFGRVEW